jgi:polyisoprenoid-binding protein YceI
MAVSASTTVLSTPGAKHETSHAAKRATWVDPAGSIAMRRLLPWLLLLAACGRPPLPPMPTPAPAQPPAYRAAVEPDAAAYAVDPHASLVRVTVRRAGLLARLGHDHVVASRSLAGNVAPAAGRADISFRLDQMTVDEPTLLRDAGIVTQPSPQAVEGTRKNMLGPVLDAQRYPVVTLHAQGLGDGRLRVAVTLHGVTRWLALPAAVQVDAAQVSASGTARLKQTDFGVTPFSVGGGLLSVQDELEIRYHIVARR